MKRLFLLAVMALALGGLLSAQEEMPGTAAIPDEDALEEDLKSNSIRIVKITYAENEFRVWDEYPWALGASFEVGGNTRESVETGYGISIDRYLGTSYVALGIRGSLHTDAKTVTTTEAMLNIRFYTPSIVKSDLVRAAFFAQFGLGGIWYVEEERRKNSVTFDALTGCRIYLNKGIDIAFLRGFYFEPFVRIGYPFMFSGGLSIGHWLNFKFK